MHSTASNPSTTRRIGALAIGVPLAIAAIVGPTGALAQTADAGNAIITAGPGVLANGQTTAHFPVTYICDAGADARVMITLSQLDGAIWGESATWVRCTGEPAVFEARVPEGYRGTWRVGEATARIDITDNTGDPNRTFSVALAAPGA